MEGRAVALTDWEIQSLIDRRGLVRCLLREQGRDADVQREVEEISFEARTKLWDALELGQ